MKIDNLKDPFATVVRVEYGEYLEELLDTVASLKNLDVNIVRAKVSPGGDRNVFYVTEKGSADKVTSAQKLEDIRMTIINNLMAYHPESLEVLGLFGRARATRSPTFKLGPRPAAVVKTRISWGDDSAPGRSVMRVVTPDRPGLLVDIVQTLRDVSIDVLSAEVDTEGSIANDTFFLSYRGEALSGAMQTLVNNALQYYLTRAEIEKDQSY